MASFLSDDDDDLKYGARIEVDDDPEYDAPEYGAPEYGAPEYGAPEYEVEDDAEYAARMKVEEYERRLTSEYRAAYFEIHPKILKTIMQPTRMKPTKATSAKPQGQPQFPDLVTPQDDSQGNMQIGTTDGNVGQHSLQPVISNGQQPQGGSATIAQKAGLGGEGPVVPAPATVQKQPTILFLATEVLCCIVDQIRDRDTLILFALTCKLFAVTAFKVYPRGGGMWHFEEWYGFYVNYDCNRSGFLLSLPMAAWMPRYMRYCRFCDQWCYQRDLREPGECRQMVWPCLECLCRRGEHRDHFHPLECPDLETCGRYSDWEDGELKENLKWTRSAWRYDITCDSDEDGDKDSDEEKDDDYCFMCSRGLGCGEH